jgi:uncharacterized protein (DUF433 family)
MRQEAMSTLVEGDAGRFPGVHSKVKIALAWRVAMNLPDFLTLWPNDEIVLTGHRIGLYSVIDEHQRGRSVEEIHAEFPTLELALIQKVLAFHASHQAEVDAYVSEYRADLDRQESASQPSEAVSKIRRLMAESAANTGSRAGT